MQTEEGVKSFFFYQFVTSPPAHNDFISYKILQIDIEVISYIFYISYKILWVAWQAYKSNSNLLPFIRAAAIVACMRKYVDGISLNVPSLSPY